MYTRGIGLEGFICLPPLSPYSYLIYSGTFLPALRRHGVLLEIN